MRQIPSICVNDMFEHAMIANGMCKSKQGHNKTIRLLSESVRNNVVQSNVITHTWIREGIQEISSVFACSDCIQAN